MPEKYHPHVQPTAPRFAPVSKISAFEAEGCLGCLKCAKRDACVYGIYKRRSFDPDQAVDSLDSECVGCLRCVQECKKGILGRGRNPQFDRLGDEYWKPEMIASIWKQAETGKIPVSGAGYRGPFSGQGFDQMWTDMSEIVRPTRDGIHGREYISTVIDLGRRPECLEFDANGDLKHQLPPYIEIPLPIVFDLPLKGCMGLKARRAMVRAAIAAGTLAVATLEEARGILSDLRAGLIAKVNSAPRDTAVLDGLAMVELPWSEGVMGQLERIKQTRPDLVTSIRVPANENAATVCARLARLGAEVIHLQAGPHGRGFGGRSDVFLSQLLREVHLKLVDKSCRDQVTLLAGGGVAMAEHMVKALISGADGVDLGVALSVGLECRICGNCEQNAACPVDMENAPEDWAFKRLLNLVGAYHSQIIELMGAMGIREARRLPGEVGRAMLFDDLERMSFAPLFGQRVAGPGQAMAPTDMTYEQDRDFHLLEGQVSRGKSRYRNPLTKHRVERTFACIACSKCVEVCGFGVHKQAGKSMLAPRSHYCRGAEYCVARGAFCVGACPAGALRVGPNPAWATFGDARWPAELLVATWEQAETGRPPQGDLEYRVGKSGGGFDRLDFLLPE